MCLAYDLIKALSRRECYLVAISLVTTGLIIGLITDPIIAIIITRITIILEHVFWHGSSSWLRHVCSWTRSNGFQLNELNVIESNDETNGSKPI